MRSRHSAEVRAALEDERAALETYHDELRRRVQELAESMVSFMDTELPVGTATAIEKLAAPAIAEPVADSLEAETEGSSETSAPELDEASVSETDDADDGLWVEMLESAIPEEDRIVDMPETAIDEVPAGPPDSFGGVPVLDEDDKPTSAGLFSRASVDEETVIGFDDLAEIEDDDATGLFGMLGERFVEQTRPGGLAEALEADDDSDDQAFRQFLEGDDAPDPSRDWLLRPEQG